GSDWPALEASLTPETIKNRPGSRFHYSNVGYGVLGELVARQRGTSWLAALRQEILAPLGMSRTSPQPEGKHALGWAVHPFADVLLPEPTPDAGAMAPAGQLWSCVSDLAGWTAFTGGDTGEVLHPDTVAEMRTVVTVDDADMWTAGYGLGFQVLRYNGRRLAGHSGSMPGFLACTLIDENTGTGALTLANTTSGPAIMALVMDLISITDEREPKLPAEWLPSAVDNSLLPLTGLWHWGPTPYHLRLIPNGMLNLAPVGTGRASRFRPVGEDEWVGLDGYYAGETLRVGRAPDGTPLYLDLAT